MEERKVIDGDLGTAETLEVDKQNSESGKKVFGLLSLIGQEGKYFTLKTDRIDIRIINKADNKLIPARKVVKFVVIKDLDGNYKIVGINHHAGLSLTEHRAIFEQISEELGIEIHCYGGGVLLLYENGKVIARLSSATYGRFPEDIVIKIFEEDINVTPEIE